MKNTQRQQTMFKLMTAPEPACGRVSLYSILLYAGALCIAPALHAHPFTSAHSYVGAGTPVVYNESTSGAPMSAQSSRPGSSAKVDATLGALSISEQVGRNGYASGNAVHHNQYTITGGTGQGVALITYYLTGDFSGSTSRVHSYSVGYGDGGPVVQGEINVSGRTGQVPPQTLTQQVNFTFGQPFEVQRSLYAALDTADVAGQSGNATLLLRAGGYTVTGSSNYTGTTSTGTTRGALFAPSAPYAGFTVQNNVGFGSITTLLDGSASTQRNVSIGYVAPIANFPAVSDIVDIQGTNTDPVVIQMKYDPLKAAELFGGETALRLAWLNSAAGQWVLATLGNAGGGPQFFNRAYNPATDFQLGNYGVDTANDVVWAVVNHNSEFAVTVVPDPFGLTAAVSRKMHNGSGPYDVALPLTGNVGVESRRANASGDHQLVLTFNAPVTSIGSVAVTSGTGSVSSTTVDGVTATVNLTGVADEQRITITLTNVSNGSVTQNVSVPMGVLAGDGTGDGTVNAGDAVGTRNRSGQVTDSTNYRYDVNTDATINAGDALFVRSRSGKTVNP